MSTATTTNAMPPVSLRQDAGVIGLVGGAHMISHFCQLLLAPLFPWLKDAFQASYTQLGFLMTLFFVVSCGVQALAGFLVDRYGPRPILFTGLATGRNFLKLMMGTVFELTDEGWRILTWRWAVFFVVLAVINEIVWRNFSFNFWAGFKLFGILPLTLVFAMAQMPVLMRHQVKPAD